MLLLNYGTYKYLYKREYIVRSNGYKLKICSGIWTDRGSNISGVYCENLFCFRSYDLSIGNLEIEKFRWNIK